MKCKAEWIDRIFVRLEECYGSLWRQTYGTGHLLERMKKEQWQTALADLNGYELARGLELSKMIADMPSAIDFWHRCKNMRYVKTETPKAAAWYTPPNNRAATHAQR